MKKILYSIIAILSIFSASSCGDMLETDNDSMVIDPSLDSKTDSVFYALGIAQAMQQLADQYFFIGEMRGELVTTTPSTNTHLRSLANYSATTANRYDSAYVYYKVINNCNYYLAHRDTTLYTGSTNVTLDEYAAVEAWRAWAYLQLARTYGGNEKKIPFFTQPLTAISQINEDNFEKKNLTEIVEALAPSLEKFSGRDVPTFGGNNFSIGSTNWGQAKAINPKKIFVPVDIILGDMYLEAGGDAYLLKAAQHYCKYLCDNKLTSDNIRSFRHIFSSGRIVDLFPEDFEPSYNSLEENYFNIFSNSPSPKDVLSYIPMAVSSQRGKTTNVPLAFGYDYYSTDKSSNCPRTDAVQIQPSKTFYAMTDSCAYYYYVRNFTTGNTMASYTNEVKAAKLGDGRANYSQGNTRLGDYAVLNRDASDSTKVYIGKSRNANICLYRTTTIYLHLAEALNRLGYPEIAFAILRNGISTYLEELVPGDTPEEYQYMTAEAVNLLKTSVPFLDPTNRNTFLPELTYGIHSHGAGLINAKGIENQVSVKGSQATSVGSRNNLLYLPKPIIGAKMQEIAEQFGVAVGTSKQDSINAMEDILCDEYAKEFAFEGIRFYDLQRMARHKNESGIYGGNFGSVWFAKKLEGNNPAVSLLDPKNWYLPFE